MTEKIKAMPKVAPGVSEETAEKHMDKILDYYDLDIEDIEDAELKRACRTSIRKMIKAFQKGTLEYSEENEEPILYQTLRYPPHNHEGRIKYNVITGRSKIAMKDNKQDDQYGRIYAFMGQLAKTGAPIFGKMKGPDVSLVECIGTLLIQV